MEEGVKMIKKILMIGNSSPIEVEQTELGVELISCPTCSQYFQELLHQEVGILLFVSEINITVRETILYAKQFTDCPFLIYLNAKDKKEEQRLKLEVEALLKYYVVDQDDVLITEEGISLQQLIEKLLLREKQEEQEDSMIEMGHYDTTNEIRDFVNTYRKTRKPFSRKLDK